MTSDAQRVLTVRDLEVRYGKLLAVQGASFEARAGEVLGIVGPNSAGKSSLLEALAVKRPSPAVTGAVDFGGEPVLSLATHRRWLRGIRLVPQGRQIFPTLSVRDNLRAIADNLGEDMDRAMQQSAELFPRVFRDRIDNAAGNLSGGEQQMLALARALIGQPQVLLLDEPGLGLAGGIVRELRDVISALAERGMAVVLADQNLGPWRSILAEVHSLNRGRLATAT